MPSSWALSSTRAPCSLTSPVAAYRIQPLAAPPPGGLRREDHLQTEDGYAQRRTEGACPGPGERRGATPAPSAWGVSSGVQSGVGWTRARPDQQALRGRLPMNVSVEQ